MMQNDFKGNNPQNCTFYNIENLNGNVYIYYNSNGPNKEPEKKKQLDFNKLIKPFAWIIRKLIWLVPLVFEVFKNSNIN